MQVRNTLNSIFRFFKIFNVEDGLPKYRLHTMEVVRVNRRVLWFKPPTVLPIPVLLFTNVLFEDRK